MSDTLVVFGTTYNNVAGFKATDSSDNTKTYIRPTGTKQIAENGTGIDVTEYASVDVNVSSGFSYDEIANRGYVTQNSAWDLVIPNATRISPFSFSRGNMKSVSAPNVLYFTQYLTNSSGNGGYAFERCTSLQTASFPSLVDCGTGGYQFAQCSALTSFHAPKTNFSTYMFYNCTSLQNIALGYERTTKVATETYMFAGCTALVAVDLSNVSQLKSNLIRDAGASVLILRDTSIVALAGTSVFDRSKFASGGTGGTIYIPKSLYDHLGDGTSSDYRAATNWSTVYGYGTITWAKIEGSQYENYYADGTAIS